MAIPFIERWRKPVSRLIALIAILLFIVSGSAWEGGWLEPVMFVLGSFLVAMGMLGRLWSAFYIGGYKTRKLITEGPYSMCRHPLYFFSFVAMMGIGLTTCTLAIPVLLGVFFAMYYPAVIRSERARLIQTHGDAYMEYANKVPAFWPKFGQLQEPESYTANPAIFRKEMGSALWFVVALGAIGSVLILKHHVHLDWIHGLW